MTLIRSDEIRTALISAIKANTTIMVLITDSNEVREHNWKGADFTYPNIRVWIRENRPDNSIACGQELFASIFGYSEENSSTQAEQIAGIIANEWHTKSLSSEGLFFTQIKADIIPSIAEEERTWRSEVQIRSIVTRQS